MGNNWLFDDGTILPVISGGSDDSLNLPSSIPGLGETNSDPVGDDLSDFARGVLNEIPEEDRPIVQKYIKTWDGNVTKKFQDYSTKLKAYEPYGSPDELSERLQFIELMDSDPIAFYNFVGDAIKELGLMPTEDNNTGLPEFEGVPEQFVQEFQSMKQMLEETREQLGSFTSSIEEERQVAQVDNLLKNMHNTFGDFDDEYVLVQIANGATPEAAIQKYNGLAEKFGSPSRKPAPKLITGAGNVPNGQVDLSKMTHKEKLEYAARRLAEQLSDN